MGAQACSHGQNMEAVLSAFRPTGIDGLRGSDLEMDLRSALCVRPQESEGQRSYPSADVPSAEGCQNAQELQAKYGISSRSMQDMLGVRFAVHRASGLARCLVCVPKPAEAEMQQRLRSNVEAVRSLQSHGVARVFEVFEDARSWTLVTERCAGGNVYDRILARQYFAEQESAVLVKHILESVLSLHSVDLAHGFLTPDAFRFASEETHAALRLVDYGLDLRVHFWGALARDGGDVSGRPGIKDHAGVAVASGPRLRNACPQLWETCRLVFGAPEVARPSRQALLHSGKARRLSDVHWSGVESWGGSPVFTNLPVEAPHAARARAEEEDFSVSLLQAADAWGVGSIAFLLLCGYPPFFAPSRKAILERVQSTDFSFDPPFWSKISEEGKDFVQRCLRSAPDGRMSVREARQHPWIQNLADNSPGGSMLNSFSLNLRRFYRTSLIETYAGNAFAAFSFSEMSAIRSRCEAMDKDEVGFLTATELRQVLIDEGHKEVAEGMTQCSARSSRQPAESYIDYGALVQAAMIRQERALEEDMWATFSAFEVASPRKGTTAEDGYLSAAQLSRLLQDPKIAQQILHNGLEDSSGAVRAVFASAVATADDQHGSADAAAGACAASSPEVAFVDVMAEIIARLPLVSQAEAGVVPPPA